MNSRTRLNLFLFTCLFLAAGWFYYIKSQPVKTLRLTSLDIDTIEQIRIPRNKNTADILLRKTVTDDNNAIWKMIEPYQMTAHQFRVNTLLGLTQTPVDQLYELDSLNLTDYALDTPRARIQFNQTEIAFGKTNPINSKRYILAENKMALVFDQIYPLVSAQATTFIDLSLIDKNSDITAIKFPDFKIARNENMQWYSTPENQLNVTQIQALIEQWKSVQAFSVHQLLPRKQLGNITIYIDNQPVNFIISDDDPWLILARPELNIEYHLDRAFKDKLLGIIKAGPDDA